MSIAEGVGQLQQQIRQHALQCGRNPKEITLVAVSKTHPASLVQEAFRAGITQFGENRLQEALPKMEMAELPSFCKWHFIGTLQTNKVTKAVGAFDLIHSVDSLALAQKISQVSLQKGVETSILLQVNTSGEASKHGLSIEEWQHALDAANGLPGIRIEGLMTIAPFVEDEAIIRQCFCALRECRNRWRSLMKDPASFRHLSMGMSHDYLIAIEEGATLLRIGTAIFGRR